MIFDGEIYHSSIETCLNSVVGYRINPMKFILHAIILMMFLLSSMVHTTFCTVSIRGLALVNDCPVYWYLICVWIVVCVVKGRSVSSVLLGDDCLQFLWLDPLSPGALRAAGQSISTIIHRRISHHLRAGVCRPETPPFMHANTCMTHSFITWRDLPPLLCLLVGLEGTAGLMDIVY